MTNIIDSTRTRIGLLTVQQLADYEVLPTIKTPVMARLMRYKMMNRAQTIKLLRERLEIALKMREYLR